MKNIYTTTLRLNLEDESDRQAFEHLRRLDRREYRSYSKAIVAAVNAFYGRKEQREADPYLETREKEDAFLRKVAETIENSLRSAAVNPLQPGVMARFLQVTASDAKAVEESATDEEDISVALDFADSF